jgi:hypothetical protein
MPSKASLYFCQTMRRGITEDSNFHGHCRGNLKSHTAIFHSGRPLCAGMLGQVETKWLVSLWTLSWEASRTATHALCRLVKAEQQAGRKFVMKYLWNKWSLFL